MKYILSIIICLALFSCHDVKVGYLETEAAQYNPNVLEVTKSQDANDPLHVVSPPIEGVEGTQPIYILIRFFTTCMRIICLQNVLLISLILVIFRSSI